MLKSGAKAASETLEIYKMLVEMADRVSQRRQAANNFYLSVNSGLIGASAYLSTLRPSWFSIVVIGLAGLGISVLWVRNIGSYKTLNAAKFKVITEVEKALPVQPFAEEWSHLDPEGRGERHRPFHSVEVAVPWVFGGVHLAQVVVAVPWSTLMQICRT